MNKLIHALKTAALVLSATALLFSLRPFAELKTLSIEGDAWKVTDTDNIVPGTLNGRTVYRLDETAADRPEYLDLDLDFEKTARPIPNYKVIRSRFELNRYQFVNGSSSGKFYYSDHGISLLPDPSSMFAPGNVTGSFTIEFWLYLYQTYNNQYVIRYMGNNLSDEQDQNVYGLSVFLRNGRIVYRFENFFWSQERDGRESFSVEVGDEENSVPHAWEHHAVSFNILNGRMSAFKNGVEQETRWVTRDGNMRSPILIPRVKPELSTPILIGQNGSFALDNLRFARNYRDQFYLKKHRNRESRLVTDVYRLSDHICALQKIRFDFEAPDYSHLKLSYRISDRYFKPDNAVLPWVSVQNGLDSFPAAHAEGKYVQFRVLAYPYEDTDGGITIRSVRLDYTEDTPPYAPAIVSATPLDSAVRITWVPSPEDDIARYEVYYGNKTEHYICADAAEGRSPVSVPASSVGKLTPMTVTLTGLENEKPYFISIRAVDTKGQKSPYSREFYAQPSTVENPDRFSVDR